MRIMIVGASGFLGRHVLNQAAAAGLEAVTAGRSPADARAAHPHVTLDMSGNGVDGVAVALAAAAPDVVVNCAGAIAGPPDVLAQVNVTGTHALVTAMLAVPRPLRLVHIGSAAEYGPGEPGVRVTEAAPPRPSSDYGVTKLAGTRLVELARSAGLDAIVLRVFNPVGPGAPPDSLPGRLVARLRRTSDDGPDIRLGPLDAVRDFVDAGDVARAVVAAALAPSLPNPVVNIAGGLGVPVRAVVKELVAISGCEVTVHENASARARSAATSWQEADITLARRDLGWRPTRDLTTSLTDLWAAA
jgi:NDP-hexose 4-ketoreductase